MEIFVIPDVHLKPKMFDKAEELMKSLQIENVICLGDVPDDFHQQYNIDLYEETYNRLIQFAEDHDNLLFCYGNHDLSYRWDYTETGYSHLARSLILQKQMEFESVMRKHDLSFNNVKIVHRIDNVLFSHAGVIDYFVQTYVPHKYYKNEDQVIKIINQMNSHELWNDYSPIWTRPRMRTAPQMVRKLYRPRKLFQVCGHTPVELVTLNRNYVSCDTFSTHSDGTPFGNECFTIVNTKTWEIRSVN